MATSGSTRLPASLRLLTTTFLTLWLIAAVFPFAWTVWGSFKVEADFFSRETWWYTIEGTRTKLQTGGAFTLDGYRGATSPTGARSRAAQK